MTQNLIAIANATGFPLQTAIEAVARKKVGKDHHWYFLNREHAWKNPETGKTYFTDLILGGQRGIITSAVLKVRMVIECKRLDGSFVFLVPQTSVPENFDVIRTYEIDRNKQPELGWFELRLLPRMQSAEFCAGDTRKKGTQTYQPDKRTLEAWCGELLAGTMAIASQDLEVLRQDRKEIVGAVYIPALVTTANLYILRCNPADMDVGKGFVPAPPESTT